MTLSLPLVTLPDAGTGQDITGRPPAPGPRLLLFRPAGLALVSPPGHGSQPASPGRSRDRSGLWLRNAAAGLGVLAAAAAAVSFTAQYRMAETARHLPVIAALEAAIPDAAALVFASLGIALALHGRRALRARALNLAAVGTSVFMNVLAAAPGWRNLAIWALPPVAYALASDTLIGVVRAWAIARHQQLGTALAADAPTPLTVLGGLALWLLRLALAPASTLAGFRAWVLEECPVAPGRRARPAPPPARSRPGRERRSRGRRPRPPGSWIWPPNGTGLSPPSRSTPSPGSAPNSRPSPACTPAPPAPPCARPSWPRRTETPDDHQVRHRAGRRPGPGRVRHVGVPARPPPARQPRPPPADPAAPAAAPRQGLRPPVHPAPALEPLRGAAPLVPDPPRPPAALPHPRSPRALGLPRPRPLPARPARPARGARPGDGTAADVQDGVPGRRHPALPRPGHRHHHQAGPVQAHQRGAVLPRPGARVQPAAHRRRPVHLLLVPGRRLPGPGHRDPPRRRVRVRRVPEGRRGRHLLVRQSLGLPARLLPRRRPRPLRPARRRRLGLRRRPATCPNGSWPPPAPTSGR